jgi:hypothetical protein
MAEITMIKSEAKPVEHVSSAVRYGMPQAVKDLLTSDCWDVFDRVMKSNTIHRILLHGVPGTGKCLGFNTPVLMYDGSVKMVQDIKNGELVMGPDSNPRTVFGVIHGNDILYRISPCIGDAFVCNKDHILSLIHSRTGKLTNISVEDYIKTSNGFKRYAKLWRTGIEYIEQPTSIPPYVAGLWLGDGTKDHPHITHTALDTEIVEDMQNTARQLGINLVQIPDEKHNTMIWRFTNGNVGGASNPFLDAVRALVINNEKRIPSMYLINSRKNRLELLAGIVDTDGNKTCNCIEICTKYEGLANDIKYLVASLGMYASISKRTKTIKSVGFGNEYYIIMISGNTNEIPCRIPRKQCVPRKQIKDVTHTGFNITNIGNGDYYGFMVDNDGLFMLGDFTVTHNTFTACKSAGHDGYYTVTLHDDSTVSELYGMWMPKGHEFVYNEGVAIKAWREGKLLVINEIDKASPAVWTVLYALLDDKEIAGLSVPNSDGSFVMVRPHPNFRVVATMNGDTSDLPAALLDRFDAKINIDIPHLDALATLPASYQVLAAHAYAPGSDINISFREIASMAKQTSIPREIAARSVFGKRYKDIIAFLQTYEKRAAEVATGEVTIAAAVAGHTSST